MKSDAIFYICITVLIIFCAGEPDLLDALTGEIGCKCIMEAGE